MALTVSWIQIAVKNKYTLVVQVSSLRNTRLSRATPLLEVKVKDDSVWVC